MAAIIFNSFVKPCVLLVEFCHGRGKMATCSFILGNLPTYEFYIPSFVARQFSFSQLPPQLFFKDKLKPREDISEILEAGRVFQLGLDLPSLCLHDWIKVSLVSTLFDSWWQRMALPPFLWTGPSFVYSPGWKICIGQRGNLLFLFKKTA